MNIPASLINATRNLDVVPLIGSGISQASGIPSWNELVTVLRNLIAESTGKRIEEIDLDEYETPDAFVRISGSARHLTSVLEEAVGRGYKPNTLHHLLSEIPFRSCLTTNWDSLIEDSLEASRRINLIFDDETARAWRESQADQIIKLHGSIAAPKSIVFGLNDYANLYQQPSVLMSLVRTLIATRPIMAIGFGMRDHFLKSLFRSVTDGGAREHFVVVSEDRVNAVRRQYLEELGLTVIPAPSSIHDPYGIGAFLKELRSQTFSEAKTRIDRTTLLIRETHRMQNYLGPEKVIRVRAAMGPLAVPKTNDLDVFGGNDVFEVENRLLVEVLKFLDASRSKLRLICCPLDGGGHSATKGYSAEAYHARLAAFSDRVKILGSKVELVTTSRPSDVNDWLAGDVSVVESRKSSTGGGRLYEYARLETDPNVVRSAIRRFDEEFNSLAAACGGIEKCREQFVEMAQREIEKS